MPAGLRPKLPKQAKPRTPRSYKPSDGPPPPHHNQRDLTRRPLVYLADGRTLTQPRLPPLPGQVGFTGDRPQDRTPRPHAGPNDMPEIDDREYDLGLIHFDYEGAGAENAEGSRHARKRENQATRWLNTIIPLLVPVYMQLVEKTGNLCTLDTVSETESACTCSADALSGRGKVKHIKVILMRWTRKLYYMHVSSTILTWTPVLEEVTIRICPCSLAAPQLLKRGFFPCAPLEPTLAFDLRVMEFAMRLFLHMPPNNTALSTTLEGYLDSMGFKLENRVSFPSPLAYMRRLTHAPNRKLFDDALETRWTGTPVCGTSRTRR